MSDQRPVNIEEEDWLKTPPIVRALLNQTAARVAKLEVQLKNPLPKLDADSNPQPGPAASPNSDGPVVGHLLVVDDNEMNQDMLSRRLQRQGHTTKIATNGRQALEMMKSEDFDLVLLDVMMPEMNGYETLECMKADEALSHIPVIMISAIDEIDSIVRCIKLGAEDYLPKPFNGTLLRARINASLEKKRLRDRQAAYLHQLNLENRRKSGELEQARRIQLSMLPEYPPALPHLDIAAYQETASEVGGDYYDFAHKTNGNLLVTIGDATGHGVGSGLLVSMTKASLLATDETDVMTLIRKINDILNEIDLGIQLNMALMLVELSDLRNGQVAVRACGGGMPPIYILSAGGSLQELIISGLPLAISGEADYRITEFTLKSGDTMILMSDGLAEMFNAQGEILTFDGLSDRLAELNPSGLTAADLLSRIAEIGHDWAKGYPLVDDVTLVTIRVK